MSEPTLSDLRDMPSFAGIVAERIWEAWWRAENVRLESVRERLEESFGPEAVPSTFVAHADKVFLGTVSLIHDDMPERPLLSPWVAALWVDPSHRNKGIGAALALHAAQAAFAAGYKRVYLCTQAQTAPYYLRQGWQRIETDIGGLDILALDAAA